MVGPPLKGTLPPSKDSLLPNAKEEKHNVDIMAARGLMRRSRRL